MPNYSELCKVNFALLPVAISVGENVAATRCKMIDGVHRPCVTSDLLTAVSLQYASLCCTTAAPSRNLSLIRSEKAKAIPRYNPGATAPVFHRRLGFLGKFGDRAQFIHSSRIGDWISASGLSSSLLLANNRVTRSKVLEVLIPIL